MATEYSPSEKCEEYQKTVFQTKQMRDSVAGSNSIKNEGELYLPMPSGWNEIKERGTIPNEVIKNAPHYLPWNHSNPAYRAYIQRARFPDITANALRMCVGIATLKEPELNLPSTIDYMEKIATNAFDSFMSFLYLCYLKFSLLAKLLWLLTLTLIANSFISPHIQERISSIIKKVLTELARLYILLHLRNLKKRCWNTPIMKMEK